MSAASIPRPLLVLLAGAAGASVANVYYAQPLLDQQCEHMDGEGVAKLVRTDRQREAILRAPLAGAGENHLPRVRADRLPDLGQP